MSHDFYAAIQRDLCHPSATLTPTGHIACPECHVSVPVYEYVARPRENDVFQSSRLAEAYAHTTGDVHVPCSVPIVGVPGIRPVQVLMPLRVLTNAVHLLRFVNDFFRLSPGPVPHHYIFKHFLKEYMETVTRCTQGSDCPQEQMILSYVLKNVQNILDQDLDIFEYYETQLVPYVKTCTRPLVVPPAPSDTTLAHQWLMELRASAAIRDHYGVYCLPLDVVHVMIMCYACATDVEVVANAAFDLMARVSRGTFFRIDTAFGEAVAKIIHDHVSYKNNTQLHYLVRDMKNGQVRECLSSLECIEKLGKLEKLLHDKLPAHLKTSERVDLALAKVFPTVLFTHHTDYYAFMMAVSHISSCVDRKTGTCPKGSFATAKRVYTVVKSFMEKVVAFEQEQSHVYWTMDVFKIFLASDADLDEQMKQLTQLVMKGQQE